MKRVYTASKLKHAKMWKDICDKRHDVIFHARWLKHVQLGTPGTVDNARAFWQEDHQDVATSDALIVYAEEGDRLRGALVEAGIAIALGVPVFLVGDSPDFGTWQYHSMVIVRGCSTIEDALEQIALIEVVKP